MSRRAQRSREEQISAAFFEHAARIEQLVELRVNPQHFAGDGCAYAWGRLAERTDIRLEGDGREAAGWVYQVAVREAWRLAKLQSRELSLDKLTAQTVSVADPGPTPFERAASREKLELLNELQPLRRDVLYLRAAGLSHKEIGEFKDLTERQVDRHLSKGRAEVRAADRTRSTVRRSPTTVKPSHSPDRGEPGRESVEPPARAPVPEHQLTQLDLGFEL